MNKIDAITEIRGFNRFYTSFLGLLNQHIIDSGYSLAEARIIYELSKVESCTANQLCAILSIERSYMSKIISKLEKNQLISRSPSEQDNRNIEIRLTEKGQKEFTTLESNANKQIDDILSNLGDDECDKLIKSIRNAKKCFLRSTKKIDMREYCDKDIPYIIDRQLSLYEQERNFTSDVWKKYLIDGVHALIEKFNPDKDCILILDCDDIPAGCIAVAHASDDTAQLRYFFLEPELRGIGVGVTLFEEALDFCRKKRYSHVFLWTVEAQEAARRMYKKYGFEVTEKELSDSWGVPVIEERWDMEL